jgi:NADPH:quinone reductase-like Zn-dependent oxidoreductase
MRAIVIEQYGGPENLAIREIPDPEPVSGQVVIEVKAFGLNHAESYFRSGVWGEVAKVTGIECVGVVTADPDGRFSTGERVTALMGDIHPDWMHAANPAPTSQALRESDCARPGPRD